jgi:hypothetical protein
LGGCIRTTSDIRLMIYLLRLKNRLFEQAKSLRFKDCKKPNVNLILGFLRSLNREDFRVAQKADF